ncbi:MAG: TonB-dependent receptor [Chlorobi bacterium]|nr:TonB-dependent receptor [Chlorobiota bacterium]
MIKLFLFVLLVNGFVLAQSVSLSGRVVDSLTAEPLINVNILVEGKNYGTASNSEGKFRINNLQKGSTTVRFSYVGYKTKFIHLSLLSDTTITVGLAQKAILFQESLVKGKYASIRETPVAFTNIDSKKIQRNLGARFLTDIIRSVPNVFVSEQGGGFADSRLSIRGFDQTSIAVMINGIPINNPENGEIYWSNWGDLSDVVQSIQVQRGLSATPYSVSSIGGVVNIISKSGLASDNFVKIKSVISSDNYKKFLFTFTTPISDNLKLTGMVSRITSNGYADQTWLDAYSYYFSLGWTLKNNLIEIQIMGSPQKHGQRMTPLTMDTWKLRGKRFNSDWGYLNGQPLNLRDNEFHKPSITLNHVWQKNKNFVLSNSLYLSYGYGGGTVPPWSEFSRTEDGLIDFDKEWEFNSNNIDSTYSTELTRSDKALRFTKHIHTWIAFLSSANYKLNNSINLTFGLDGKYYSAENYSTLGNLLGGDYYIGSGNVNQDPDKLLYVGDKVDYDADSYARSLGVFFQAEHNKDALNAYVNLAFAVTGYNRIDHFNYKYSDPKRETGWKQFPTYTIKAGINYNFNDYNNAYFNIGNYSKAPLSMNVYSYTNEPYADVKNEKVISAELGYGYNSEKMYFRLNTFITWWKDKAFNFAYYDPNSFQAYKFNIYGAKALHRGIEGEGKYHFNKNISLDGMLSVSINNWLNDVTGYGHLEALPGVDIPVNAKIGGLYVGGFPMLKMNLGVDFTKQIFKGLIFYFNPKILFNGLHYPHLNISGRNDDSVDLAQPSKIPNYYLINLHLGFDCKVAESFIKNITLGMNIYNLLNKDYMIDAYESISGTPETTTVWLARDRWMDVSLMLGF